MDLIIYYGHFLIALLIQLLLFKTKVYYEDGNKQSRRIKEGAIIISNHRSFLDGIVIALNFFLNRLHFISEDFFKYRYKIVKVIVNIAGGIFIDKEVYDFNFIEKCKKVTAKGRSIMIFPEGGFQYTYEPTKFYPGYILLAIKTGAKIIPIVNDFNYGLFKRVHIMIGNSIDLSEYSNTELTWKERKKINKEIYHKYLMLFYELKRKKAEKFSFEYDVIPPKPGDVIRIPVGHNHHYGVYFNDNEVIQFGHSANKGNDIADEEIVVNSVSLKEFCDGKNPEVRIIKKRFTRKIEDIEKYAKSCLGQGRYDIEKNNCLDFVNRVTLKI